mmetsp:Transcript_83003/g.199173  ORF Transcript_83003/g.199173 Transcript_83003/m.199173 type:complete len:92 (-) Transcript_83003:12-287(-)
MSLNSLQPVLEKLQEKRKAQTAMCFMSKSGHVIQSVGDAPSRPEFLTKVAQGAAHLEPSMEAPVITIETTARTLTIMDDNDVVLAVAEKAD